MKNKEKQGAALSGTGLRSQLPGGGGGQLRVGSTNCRGNQVVGCSFALLQEALQKKRRTFSRYIEHDLHQYTQASTTRQLFLKRPATNDRP